MKMFFGEFTRKRNEITFLLFSAIHAVWINEDKWLALRTVASAPVLVSKAAEMLMGKRPEPALIESASLEASKLAKPMDNTDMNLSYRKKMVSVFVSYALMEASGQGL